MDSRVRRGRVHRSFDARRSLFSVRLRMTNAAAATPADTQPVRLARATGDAYGQAARSARHNSPWWYINGLVKRHRKPFADRTGRWWWLVKPGFAWPFDFFTSFTSADGVRPLRRLLGWQFPVNEPHADSRVHLNVIHQLHGYDLDRLENKKRRNTIRKALRELLIEPADPSDQRLIVEAQEVWDSHVARTGWNSPMSVETIGASWRELANWPGTTVLVARRRTDGSLCAWLIARIIDNTVFIDTLTSHSDRLESCPNDGLVFQCLRSAALLGVQHAHYALKSRIASLEAFKQALGFTPHPFPTKLHLRPFVGTLLRTMRPALYKRLCGDESWSD